jgi:hypothetical protein
VKILLDESVPRILKLRLPLLDISTLLGSWFVNPASQCMPNYGMQGTALGATSHTTR